MLSTLFAWFLGLLMLVYGQAPAQSVSVHESRTVSQFAGLAKCDKLPLRERVDCALNADKREAVFALRNPLQ